MVPLPTVDIGVHGEDLEEQERLQRLAERWKFDTDDMPDGGADGPEETDRILIDDYEPK